MLTHTHRPSSSKTSKTTASSSQPSTSSSSSSQPTSSNTTTFPPPCKPIPLSPFSNSPFPSPPSSPTNQTPQLTPHSWQTFFLSLQKSHHQSPSIPKILSAVKIYGSLARFGPPIGKMALRKLERMGGHKYPRVREKVEEEVWVVGGGQMG